MQRSSGISFFWGINDSLEFIEKVSNIKTPHSIKTLDFLLQILIHHKKLSIKVLELL